MGTRRPPNDLIHAKQIADTIVAAGGDRLRQVILHGSRAHGGARPNSDFDVLVVVDDPITDWVAESMHLRELFYTFPHPVDVQVFGHEEFETSSHVPGTLAYPAVRRGIILYDRSEVPPGRARSRARPVG